MHIIVDEAHLLEKHESFRECMKMLSFLGLLAVSLILMTVTCPQDLENLLFQKLGWNMYQVVQQSTDHPEISHEMIPVQACQDDFEQLVATNVLSTISFSTNVEHALLFCNLHDKSDHMARLLG